MKTQNGFTLLENKKDIKYWLAKQKVTRKITRLQVHHMDSPIYSTWKELIKKYSLNLILVEPNHLIVN